MEEASGFWYHPAAESSFGNWANLDTFLCPLQQGLGGELMTAGFGYHPSDFVESWPFDGITADNTQDVTGLTTTEAALPAAPRTVLLHHDDDDDYAAKRAVAEKGLRSLTLTQLTPCAVRYNMQQHKSLRKEVLIQNLLQQLDHMNSHDKAEAETFMRHLATVKCAKCSGEFIVAQSFGIGYDFDDTLCFSCTTKAQDPFHSVVQTLAGPVVDNTANNATKLAIGFTLPRCLQNDERVVIRPFCTQYKQYIGQRKKHDATPRLPPNMWPMNTSNLSVNMTPKVPIVQGQWKQTFASVVFKGESRAVDITQFVVKGRNTIEIKRDPNYTSTHWFVVQVLKKRSVEDVVTESRLAAKFLGVEESRAFIQQTLRGDDDDDVMCMSTTKSLSTRCVLTAARLHEPTRGKLCRHLECFNLEPLVRSMERVSPGTYRCPQCMAPLTLGDLVIDEYLQKILSETDKDVETIYVQENGDWTTMKQT